MPPPILGCPVFEFKPRVSFRNELLLPASLYGIRVPSGLSEHSVPAPVYVSPQEMLTHLRSQPRQSSGGHIGIVHGLTTAQFSLRFSDLAQQWRSVSRGRSTVPWWQFQGGDIYFEVEIGLYVLEGDRPVAGDAESEQIFVIIMEHELLHIADEIDLITNWLPPQAYQDTMVRRYLSEAEPLDDQMFRHWFQGPAFESWIRNGLWALEHNRRGSVRDAPAEYRALQDRIDQLRIRQINRPSRP